MRERRGLFISLLMLSLVLAGCGGTGSPDPQATTPRAVTTQPPSPEPGPTTDYPAHALLLRDTIARSFAHRRFIAFNIRGPSSQLDVVGRDGELRTLTVAKGKHYTVDELTFQVLEVVPNLNRTGAPGGSTGRVVILPITA